MNDMTEIQIAWLELIMVGGIGFALALSGIIINIVGKKRNKACTEQTEGNVIQHGFPGDGRMYPIVEYSVNGISYKTKKKFRGVKTKSISGFPIHVQSNAYEDDKGWLHVKVGPITNLRHLAEQLWPIGCKMTVFYNPSNPNQCYVERPISGSFVSTMFVIGGGVVIFSGFVVFVLMQI